MICSQSIPAELLLARICTLVATHTTSRLFYLSIAIKQCCSLGSPRHYNHQRLNSLHRPNNLPVNSPPTEKTLGQHNGQVSRRLYTLNLQMILIYKSPHSS